MKIQHEKLEMAGVKTVACLLVALAIAGPSIRSSLAKSIIINSQQQEAGESASQRYLRTLLPNHQLVPFRSFISSEQVRAQFAHLAARAAQPKQSNHQSGQQPAGTQQIRANTTLASTHTVQGAQQSPAQQPEASSRPVVNQSPPTSSGQLPMVSAAPRPAQVVQRQQSLQRQQPSTPRPVNQSRTGSEYEHSASSAQVQLSELSDGHQTPAFAMVAAQTRQWGSAVAPAAAPTFDEPKGEPEEFGGDESDETEEQPAPRSSLRPAQMPNQSSRQAAASNRQQLDSLDEQADHQSMSQLRQYAPRAPARGLPAPPAARRSHNNYQQQQPQHRQQQQDPGEAAAKQHEAAEASEAELADRSALDEQQQAQREIILAQAQSEAKAIKEQQEALTRLQALQQQMILRRQNDLEKVARGEPVGDPVSGQQESAEAGKPKKNQKKIHRQQEYNGDEDSDEQEPQQNQQHHHHQHQQKPSQHSRWSQSQAPSHQHNQYYPQPERAGHLRFAQPKPDETLSEGSSQQVAHVELTDQSVSKYGPGGDLMPAAQQSHEVRMTPMLRHRIESH